VIEEGAASVGLTMDELLPAIDMIRYSTTIALNRLIEKKGRASASSPRKAMKTSY